MWNDTNAQGFYVPSSQERLTEVKQKKVYFEDLTQIGIQKSLNNIKTFMEGVKYTPRYEVFVKDGTNEYIPPIEKKFNGYAHSKLFFSVDDNILIPYNNILLKKNTHNNILKFDFKIVGNSLVSNKIYTSKNEILVDMYQIHDFFQIQFEHNPKLASILGTTRQMVLDYDYLKENKLAFTILKNTLNFAPKLKEQIKEYGFTLVDKKEDADKIVYFDYLGSFQKIEIEKNQELFSNNSSFFNRNAGNFGNMSMNLTNSAGHSSLHSAQAGLAIFALSFAFSVLEPDNMRYSFPILRVIDKKEKLFTTIVPKIMEFYYKEFNQERIDYYLKNAIAFLDNNETAHFNAGTKKIIEKLK